MLLDSRDTYTQPVWIRPICSPQSDVCRHGRSWQTPHILPSHDSLRFQHASKSCFQLVLIFIVSFAAGLRYCWHWHEHDIKINNSTRPKKDIPMAVQKMFAPVAPLIAWLKLQCSEVHVYLMCLIPCLRSCEYPEVKEGSWGCVEQRISPFALLLLCTLQMQLSWLLLPCATRQNSVPPCRHTKPDPRAMHQRDEINVADPDTLSLCLFLFGYSLLVYHLQFRS